MICSDFNYDDFYGLTLEEYCDVIGISIETLINKNTKEIEVLKNRLNKLVWAEVQEDDEKIPYLINCIARLIEKKEKHLDRLKKWKRKSNKK